MGGIQSALLNVAITAALPYAVDMVKNVLTRDHINLYGDKVFDFCEDFILGASIKVDDKYALPFPAQAARDAMASNRKDRCL